MKKNYALIDIFKFTFAIVVVFIHTCSERYQNGLTTILTSMAVPYFFVASGFFLNKKFKIFIYTLFPNMSRNEKYV